MTSVAAAQDQTAAAAAVRIYDDVPPPPSAPSSVSSSEDALLQQSDSSNLTKHDNQVSQSISTRLPSLCTTHPSSTRHTNSSHCVHVNTDNDLVCSMPIE